MCGMVLLTSGVIIANSYRSARAGAQEVMLALTSAVANQTEEKVRGFLAPAADTARLALQHIRAGVLDIEQPDAVERWFFGVLEGRPDLAVGCWASEQGNFYMIKRMPDGSLDTKFITRRMGPAGPGGRRPELSRTTRWRYRAPGMGLSTIEKTDDTNDPYDHFLRGWYVDVRKHRSLRWSGAYVFWTDKRPGITVSVPHEVDERFLGTICVDIRLDAISRFLRELTIAEHGIAVILNPDGTMIAGPDPADITMSKADQSGFRLRDVSESSLPAVADLADAPGFREALDEAGDKLSLLPFESAGSDWVAGLKAVPIGGGRTWIVGVLVPEDDFLAPINRTNTTNLVTSALFLLVALLIVLMLSRWIARSLKLLVSETDSIRRLRFVNSPSRSPFREVDQVLRAFEEMKVGLRSFQKYLPLKLVRKLLQNREEPELGGEFQELTIYFSDIAGFTPINESMHPMEMAVRLGRYLGAMTEEMEARQGTVVQYVGDEIMGLWGAPQPVEDHAVRACEAALACARRVETLWPEGDDCPKFHTRFGIHTARVAVGHFGSEDRLYYGAIGDGINLTSRLEGVNKYYGTQVIISADTYRLVRESFEARRLDLVAVKGKERPIGIYELLGRKGEVEGARLEAMALYEQAFVAYLNRRFEEAMARFEQVLTVLPSDRPSQTLAERCRHYVADPPPPEWSGVWIMTAK